MRPNLALCLPALALAGTALMSEPAHAGKGLMIVTHGDAIAHYADLTGEGKRLAEESTGHEVRLGYLYQQFGVFWLELWSWDGAFVLYQEDKVWNLTDEEAAMLLGVQPGELGKPFLYRFPLGLLILGGVVAGLLVISRMGKKSTPATPSA